MKSCSKCGESKPLDAFHRDKSARDGHCSRCKECACAVTAQWIKANPELHLASRRRRKDAARAWNMEYHRRNRERIVEAKRRKYKEQASNDDSFKEKVKGFRKRAYDLMTRSYLAKTMRLPVGVLTKELEEAKRQQLRVLRLLKEKL